jgi:hypothetical protein
LDRFKTQKAYLPEFTPDPYFMAGIGADDVVIESLALRIKWRIEVVEHCTISICQPDIRICVLRKAIENHPAKRTCML